MNLGPTKQVGNPGYFCRNNIKTHSVINAITKIPTAKRKCPQPINLIGKFRPISTVSSISLICLITTSEKTIYMARAKSTNALATSQIDIPKICDDPIIYLVLPSIFSCSSSTLNSLKTFATKSGLETEENSILGTSLAV